MNSKHITPINEKGERHGYWEQYWGNGQLWYKGNFVNGSRHGCWEYYCPNGKLNGKFYYQYGKKINLINFLIIKLYNLIKF
jgi:antitoxin component YwqK of YwqJK toxin-antitoxin module